MHNRPPLFNFTLRAIKDVDTFGDSERHLQWFGLTDGWYWIAAGEAELFRASEAWLNNLGQPASELPYVIYYVVRLWEDLLGLLPEVLVPIPPELFARVREPDLATTWVRAGHDWAALLDLDEGYDLEDAYELAVGWYRQRRLHTAHLRHAPSIWFLRVGETMKIRWDNRQHVEDGITVWSAGVGEYELSVESFLQEVTSFHGRLMTAMRERVASAVAHWPRPDVQIDLPGLAREQVERETWLNAALDKTPSTSDWASVREALAVCQL